MTRQNSPRSSKPISARSKIQAIGPLGKRTDARCWGRKFFHRPTGAQGSLQGRGPAPLTPRRSKGLAGKYQGFFFGKKNAPRRGSTEMGANGRAAQPPGAFAGFAACRLLAWGARGPPMLQKPVFKQGPLAEGSDGFARSFQGSA